MPDRRPALFFRVNYSRRSRHCCVWDFGKRWVFDDDALLRNGEAFVNDWLLWLGILKGRIWWSVRSKSGFLD